MHDQATRSALPPPIPRKSRVSLRPDTEVLVWFRGQVREHGGGHCQTMINVAFQQHIFAQGKTLEDRVRREEHLGWLIQKDYQHLLRHVARLNEHLEEAHERGFTALDGRRFEIRERRLRP